MTKLDVRLVRGFVAVADERSFTRAAERLHVAQPWLSVQIRKLEEQVGFRLFERNRNQAVLLSTQAEALLPFARDYLAAAERMEGSARRICDSATMTLRLGAPDFSAEMPMRTAIVDQFTVAHPEFELEVSNAWTVELLKRVRDGELDAAFTVGPHVDASTEAMVVARYHLALLGCANDLVGLPPKSPLSALAGRTVATFRRSVNAPFHDAIVPALEAAGVTVAYLTEAGHSAIMHNTLRTGMLALVGDYVPTTGLAEPLEIVSFDDPALSFNLNLVRRVGDRSSAVSALWVQAMHAIARS